MVDTSRVIDAGQERLMWDTRHDAQAATAAGWYLDDDDWWTRPNHEGEADIEDSAVGFSTLLRHFVRSAVQALAYDRQVKP